MAPFQTVTSVHASPACAWKVALAEQRKGLGERRERHLENASRLREMGWAEKINQRQREIER